MPIQIKMPALSPTMTEATIANWLIKEGDQVEPGMVIAEIETDKAIMEFEAVGEGILHKIILPSGSQNIKVGEIIAIVKEEDDTPEQIAAAYNNIYSATAEQGEIKTTSTENAPNTAGNFEEEKQNINNDTIQNDNSSLLNTPSVNKINCNNVDTSKRIHASPLAKKIAQQHNLNLNNINCGSGPNGRIIKNDVLAAISDLSNKTTQTQQQINSLNPQNILQTTENNLNATANNQQQSTTTNSATASYTSLPISGMRKVIAARLSESKQTIPHFYLSSDCEVTKLMELRQEINRNLEKSTSDSNTPAIKVSINDLIIKAVAKAATLIPEATIIWDGNQMIKFNNVDIAVAISIPDGLVTPVIKNAETKTISSISNEVKEMAARARSGKIRTDELKGGSITISNLGMYRVDQFYAIINPPHSSIIAVGGIKKCPIVIDDQIAIGNVMNLTISCDHRVMDGAVAAQFINHIKDLLENPMNMLI